MGLSNIEEFNAIWVYGPDNSRPHETKCHAPKSYRTNLYIHYGTIALRVDAVSYVTCITSGMMRLRAGKGAHRDGKEEEYALTDCERDLRLNGHLHGIPLGDVLLRLVGSRLDKEALHNREGRLRRRS